MRTVVAIALIITAMASVAARGQSLQEQAICAAQAEKAYQQYNNAGSLPGFKLETGGYESHYNTKLNKCFILTSQIVEYNGQTMMTEQLSDAFERHVFANYSFNLKNNIMDCRLTPTLDKTVTCSHAEFEAFAAKYMEE